MPDRDRESLLLQRYGQVEQDNQAYNRTIHNSFYLSVVFLGAVIAIDDLSFWLLALFLVFWLLGAWNLRAMIDRGKVRERKRRISEAMNGESEGIYWDDILGKPDESGIDGWTDRRFLKRTDYVLLVYYAASPLVLIGLLALFEAAFAPIRFLVG